MAATKTVQVLVIGDSRSAQAALKAVSGQATVTDSRLAALGTRMQSWGRSMSSAGSMLTRRVSLPIALVGGAMVKLASDAGETRNKVGEIFGGMADEIETWSDTAIERMGLAQATAQNMASEFGLLFQAAKLPGPEVVGLSEDFTQLAADMASFFNVRPEDALMALRSGLTGEAEPLRRFGVFLNEAAVAEEAMRLGIVEAGEALTDQQKVVARASIIQESLTTASGDYARTSHSVANRARAVTEKFKEMGADLGQKLLPLAEKLLTWASDMLDKFSALSPGTQEMILKIAGLAAVTGPLLRVFGPLVTLAGKFAGWLPKIVPWLLKWGAIKSLPMPTGGVVPVAGGRQPPGVVAPVVAGGRAGRVAGGLRNSAGLLGGLALVDLLLVTKAWSDTAELIGMADEAAGGYTKQVLSGVRSLEDLKAAADNAADSMFGTDWFTDWQLDDSITTTTEAVTDAWRDLVQAAGGSETAVAAFNDIMVSAAHLTRRETVELASMVVSLDRNKESLSDLEFQQVKNLAKAGDFEAIMKILTGRIDESYEGVKKYNPKLDELSDASLAARNAMKSQYEWTKLLNNETKRGAPFFRSMSTATGILATDLRDLATAAQEAYDAYFGTGGGGGGGTGGGGGGTGGGGGGGTGGGGHRDPKRDPRTDRRRFNRASEYERYAAR